MARVFHIAAIVTGSLSFVFVVVALAMPAWLKGCMSMDNILKVGKYTMETQGQDLPSGYDTASQMFQGQSMCINLGFFKSSMTLGQIYDVAIGVDFMSMPRYFAFTAIAFIVVSISLMIAVILLIVAASVSMDTYEAKTKVGNCTRRAMLVFVEAGLITLGFMIYYTASTAHIIHNPIQFFAAFGQSVASAFSGMNQNMGGNSFLSRGKRDLDLTGVGGVNSEALKLITDMISDMDPMYSHCFYLGWVAFVAMVISGVLAFMARRNVSEQPYSAAVAKV